MKEFTIKINGTEQIISNVDKLKNSLDKVDTKIKGMSISANEIATLCKNDIQEVTNEAILHSAKLEAILTELTTHTEQAVDKNKQAAEKLVQSMEKSDEGVLSSIKATVKELPVVMESYLNMMTNMSGMQSALLEEQTNKNKELIGKSLDEIEVKFVENDKKIKDADLNTYKKYVEEVKKYKTELQNAIIQTGMQYDAMSKHYDKDSDEFKKVQDEKKAALDSLQKKIEEVDKDFKESGANYLEVWKKQHDEIKTKLNDLTKDDGGIQKFIDKYSYGFKKFSTDFDGIITTAKNSIENLEKEEKETNNIKYEKELEKLNKELENAKTEVTKNEKEKAQYEKEQQEAKAKAEKYRADIDRIKKSFEIEDYNPNPSKEEATPLVAEKSSDLVQNMASDIPASDGEEDKNKPDPASEEEIQAAKDRIDQLDKLAKGEEKTVNDKQANIDEKNKLIIESNRSVLLEEMRIEEEKTKLKEEKEKKDAEITEKAQKKKEKLEKLEKIKAKAKAVYDIAVATKEIAAGVAAAWGKGPIVGPPLAALVAIQGALQLKTMTQQLKYLEDGGLLRGKRHSQGGMRIEGTNIEVEGGEYVINRESTSKNLGLVRYINSNRKEITPTDLNSFFSKASQGYELPFRKEFERGGELPAIITPSTLNNEILVDAIKAIRIEPKVAVTDILRVQDEMTQVDGWSGI